VASPYHHALSSVRQWGGIWQDYHPIHQWFDESKAHHADFRHRALRHHAEGIFLCEQVFGTTIALSTCSRCGHGPMHDEHMVTGEDPDISPHLFTPKRIPVRWVGEQHVKEDLGGRIPAATEWLSAIKAAPWMDRSRRLSEELEGEIAAESA
jgi:hypothetical protein